MFVLQSTSYEPVVSLNTFDEIVELTAPDDAELPQDAREQIIGGEADTVKEQAPTDYTCV